MVRHLMMLIIITFFSSQTLLATSKALKTALYKNKSSPCTLIATFTGLKFKPYINPQGKSDPKEERIAWHFETNEIISKNSQCPLQNSFDLSVREGRVSTLPDGSRTFRYPVDLSHPKANQRFKLSIIHVRKNKNDSGEWLITDWDEGFVREK